MRKMMSDYNPMRCPHGISRDNRMSWSLGDKNYILYKLKYEKRAAFNELPLLVSGVVSLLYSHIEYDTNVRVNGLPSIDSYQIFHVNKLDKKGFVTNVKVVTGFDTELYTNLPIEKVVGLLNRYDNITVSVETPHNVKLSYDNARLLEQLVET